MPHEVHGMLRQTIIFSFHPRIFLEKELHIMSSTGTSVTRGEIISARSVSLYDYVLAYHGSLFKRSGQSLFMRDNNSLYIKKGFPGYNDFSSETHGNPIDFLMKYLGYSFLDAVTSLNRFSTSSYECSQEEQNDSDHQAIAAPKPVILPPAADRPFRNMYAYLMGRGIPAWMIRQLEQQDLVYQDRDHNNIVFVSKDKDYCELRGTFTYADRPFHGCRKAGPDRFWYISPSGGKPETAYVCEAAIDAVSLYLIHKSRGNDKKGLYVSIGGVANQQAIQRLKNMLPVKLAVDNDRAGKECRDRNPDLPFIIPFHKDWNEDLQCHAY